MGQIRRRLTYANVVATLALFLAVGGGAYAVSKIGSNQIRRNAIKSKHVAKNALRGADVRESSLGTVPNSEELGGHPLGEIVRRIDFRQQHVTSASAKQTIGGVELTYTCSVIIGNGTLTIDGERKVDGSVAFDGAVVFGNNSVDHIFGAFEPDGTLFSGNDSNPQLGRGVISAIWREPDREVSIHARFFIAEELGHTDCFLDGLATIAAS
jgi:hypothetical protein